MKKFNNLYIDDFMLEKEISQGIGVRMTEQYHIVFRLFISSHQVIASDLSTYTTSNFKRFLGDNLIERNWSSSTYNSYRKYLRCYCEFLKNEGYLDENPFDKIQKRKVAIQLPKTLTKGETKELLNTLSKVFDISTYVGKRNQTIVYTYLYTGLRLSELLNLKLHDLQIEDGYLMVNKGKGSKDRVIPLSKDLIQKLNIYLRVRNGQFKKKENDVLFPTSYGNTLQKRDMKTIIDQIRKNISFHFTWHQLRHTFATELVRNNFDIYNISRILGHTRIDTTKIYLSVDTERIKQQLDNIALFA